MAKGKYGVTPWGAWFIDVLDGYSMGARLDRGRSYANTGKVLALELTEGKAVAKVAGNYKPFYRVTIEFPPLKEAETVYRLIEADPVLLAHIARGELPETFLQKLRKAGIDLIPRRWRDMRRSCTCPDYGDPCKHMAALYYIIAREIDADPAVLFRLRGMDLAERFGKATVREIPPPFVVSAAPSAPTAGRKKAGAKAGKKALVQKGGEGEPDTTAQDAAEPDTAALVETALGELPDCHGLITSLLPSDPPFCDRNFAFSLAEFYHRCAAGEVWVDADGGNYFETGETVEHRFSRSHWALRCDKEAGPGVLPVLEETNVRGQTYNHSIYDVWWQFSTFSGGAETTGTSAYTFLFCLFKFIGLLLRASAFIPYVLHQNGSLRIIWRPYDAIPPVARALEALSRLETGLLPLSGTTRASGRSVVDLVSSAILNEWVRRRWFSRRCPQGSQDFRRLLAVFFAGEPLPVDTPDQRSLPLAIDRWLSVLHVDFAKYRYSFTVKPIKSGVQGGGSLPPVPVLHSGRNVRASPATPPSGWPSTSPSAGLCPATPRWGVENPPDPPLLDEQDFALSIDVLGRNKDERAIKTPLYKIAANKKSGLVQEEAQAILRPLTALSNYLPEIRSLMKHKSVELSSERLTAFLESAAPLLSQLGITVTLPKSLRKELKPRLVLQTTGKDKGRVVSYLDLDSILHWKWQIAIGERILDAEEFTKLIKEKRALVRFRDGFVKIDPSEFAALLKKAGKPPPDSLGFLKAHLEGDSILSFDAEAVIRRLFEERHFEAPPALSANLRPYQLRGYNWACSLLMAGFGCV
ncbi:MAG: SWIM zinc finger family protein, partial [Spirochaetaceae bacterium]|nr:SWIM zinc finger family protein [Spirochaetaceae bacterium]